MKRSTPLDPSLAEQLADTRYWLFDMDNSLYPASVKLFSQIDLRMEAFVANLLQLGREDARTVQKRYFHEHGTTLRGLMLSHGVEPHEFLDFVHDIDLSVLTPDPRQQAVLAGLPGRKIVFTNGDTAYAERVLGALGIAGQFEAIFDIEAMDWHPKPDPRSYKRLVDVHGVDPSRAIFADDMAYNLMPAHELGMLTLWVNNGSERGDHLASQDFIDFETHSLTDWLETYT